MNSFTAGDQWRNAVAVDAAGGFVVVWDSDGQDGSDRGVFGQRFDPTGRKIGGEFQVNTYTPGNQLQPGVAMRPSGEFVVVWSGGGDEDGSSYGVFRRRFDALGVAVGPALRVNRYTVGHQAGNEIGFDAAGGSVVVWNSRDQDGSELGVFGQRFDPTGRKVGGEFQVNTYTTGSQWSPALAVHPSGGFVVVWDGGFQDEPHSGIFGQRFDATGRPAGVEFQVNQDAAGGQIWPAVASLSDEGFVVVWRGHEEDGTDVVVGRRHDPEGTPLGDEFQVAQGAFINPKVTTFDRRGFVVTWEALDGGYLGVFAKRYAASGDPVGGEFLVNTNTASTQFLPAIASAGGTGFVITWDSSLQDGSELGVFGQRYEAGLFADGFESGDSSAWSSTVP